MRVSWVYLEHPAVRSKYEGASTPSHVGPVWGLCALSGQSYHQKSII